MSYQEFIRWCKPCVLTIVLSVFIGINADASPNSVSDNQTLASICPQPAAHSTISVGANKDVGSKANFKEKAKGKASGVAGKALSGLLGVSVGSGKSAGPKTRKDPIKNKKKVDATAQANKGEIRSGAKFTDDGLLISTDILKAPGKGTFQTVYLENQQGWRMMPIAMTIYKIWQNWKLTVSWTRDTYVDGQHVKHEEGGWSESWRELVAEGEVTKYGYVEQPAIWQQLGFNVAVSGARSLGTLFPISQEMLAAQPINLVIHVTNPNNDPVDTTPYIYQLSVDDEENIVIAQIAQSTAVNNIACAKANPCTNKCVNLLKAADNKEAIAKKLQEAADKAKQDANKADQLAKEAEDKAKQAEELAKDETRDDKAIVDGEEYTTADTEYRIMLQGEINVAHKAGEISNKEHEKQTKANTVKNAREKRLQNLAKLKKEADKARAEANEAKKESDKVKAAAENAKKAADDAHAEAKAARQAYDDCIKKAKEECDKQKAAETKRIADEKAAAEKLRAEQAQAEAARLAEEKSRANQEKNRQLRIEEDKRLLELIKKLGLIDKRITEVPSLWGWLPDVIETPVGMLAESGAIPIPTDVLKGLGGLYGIIGSMLNPCTKAGIEKTERRLRNMKNERTGKNYTEAEASKETAEMCRLLGDIRGRLVALRNAQKK